MKKKRERTELKKNWMRILKMKPSKQENLMKIWMLMR